MTSAEFDRLAGLMRRYADENAKDFREGGACELCHGTPSEHKDHAALERPVCQVVEALIDRAAALVEDGTCRTPSTP